MRSARAPGGTTVYQAINPLVFNPALLSIARSIYDSANLFDRVRDRSNRTAHSHLDGRITRGLDTTVFAYASCRTMFLSQPPTREVYVGIFGRNKTSVYSYWNLYPAPDLEPLGEDFAVHNDRGVTYGDVVDAIQEETATYSKGKYWAYLRLGDGFAVSQEEFEFMEEVEEIDC